MGLLTKQDIDDFYEKHKNEEVIFNKTISELFGIQPKHIFLKFKDIQRTCIIYSSSMTEAKVLASLAPDLLAKLKNEHSINLRFAIKNEEKKNDILFFYIKCKTKDITVYKAEQNLFILHFEYLGKPPEDLIIMLGRLLEAKKNAQERCEERIIIDKNNISKLGFNSTAVNITIDNIPRQAILRDLSFNGMKLLLSGNSRFLNNKIIKVEVYHRDYNNLVLLGKSIRAEQLMNRKDIAALAILFDSKCLPIQYSLIINEYLKSQKFIQKINKDINSLENNQQ